jgi:hypothetical protein
MDQNKVKDQSTKEQSEGDVADVVRKITVDGREQVISHTGVSQYTPGGVGASACGIAALNCVRVVFGKEQEGAQKEALLKEIVHRHTVEVRNLIANFLPPRSTLYLGDYFNMRSVVERVPFGGRRNPPGSFV